MQIELDIIPDKTFQGDDVQVPEGYHLSAGIADNEKQPEEKGDTPFFYPAGMGQVLMNGCFGRDYKEGDPCFKTKRKAKVCYVSRDVMAARKIFF